MEYKGKELKKGITVDKTIIDGKEVVKLNIPKGCKSIYAEDDVKKKKKTVREDENKQKILNPLLNLFVNFSSDNKIYKAGTKYSIKTQDGKWFSLALTANKVQPKDLEEYNLTQEE